MEISLHGRVALVTGGGEGLGRAIAFSLASAGADVVVGGRRKESLEEVAGSLRQIGVKSYPVVADVIKLSEVKFMFRFITEVIGSLDILVNNVGRAEPFGNFFDLTDNDWMSAYNLNFMSMVRCSREAIPLLKKSDCARIINISSVPARQPGMFNPHYSAAKAAMLNLSKHLATVLAPDRILVNAICPSTLKGGSGWVRNAENRARRDGTSLEEAEEATERTDREKAPLQRLGTLRDVASLVTFLASPEAGFITGTVIDVDGGTVRSII